MKDLRKQYLEALENADSYDFIAKNYYEFSKEELKDIILELDYAIHSEAKHFASAEEIYTSASEELQERWHTDDDDEEEDEDDERVFVPLRDMV